MVYMAVTRSTFCSLGVTAKVRLDLIERREGCVVYSISMIREIAVKLVFRF